MGRGNNWVIAAIVVRLPFLSRPVALPVLARLLHKDLKPAPASRLTLARQMTAALARPDLWFRVGADLGDRNPTISLGSGPDRRAMPSDLRWRLAVSGLLASGVTPLSHTTKVPFIER